MLLILASEIDQKPINKLLEQETRTERAKNEKPPESITSYNAIVPWHLQNKRKMIRKKTNHQIVVRVSNLGNKTIPYSAT